MVTYEQKTGRLLDANNKLLATGYSGFGKGKNNPLLQTVRNVGPIPIGEYIIGEPYNGDRTGIFTLPLTPIKGTKICGRSGFAIHGDSKAHPGTASNGCIIVPNAARKKADEDKDRRLKVV
jgi:hypothetical protein